MRKKQNSISQQHWKLLNISNRESVVHRNKEIFFALLLFWSYSHLTSFSSQSGRLLGKETSNKHWLWQSAKVTQTFQNRDCHPEVHQAEKSFLNHRTHTGASKRTNPGAKRLEGKKQTEVTCPTVWGRHPGEKWLFLFFASVKSAVVCSFEN